MQMNITRGVQQSAKKVVIYGPEGIGKSTFASQFPNPVFIDTEGSTTFMDIARAPRPTSFAMLLEQIKYFIAHPNELRTLVIDTADWAERMCLADLLESTNKKSIESFNYGKGYTMVYEQFGGMLNLCTTLVETCGVNVIITAHAWMRKFEQPDELGSYDRWELKLIEKTSARDLSMLKEWADILLFANYKTIVVNVDDRGATKGKNKVQGGKRVMHTTHHPCWDAKNRFGLAEELPFEFAQIAHLIHDKQRDAAEAGVPLHKIRWTIVCVVSISVAISICACFVQHLSNYAVSIGLSLVTGGIMVSFAMAGSVIAKFLLGIVNDKVDTKTSGFIGFFIVLCAMIILPLGGTILPIVLLGDSMIGFSMAAYTVLMPLILSDLFPKKHFSRVLIYTTIASTAAGSIGATLIGYFFDGYGSYLPVFAICGGLTIVCIILLAAAYRIKKSFVRIC